MQGAVIAAMMAGVASLFLFIIYLICRATAQTSSFVSKKVKEKANSIISQNTVDKAYYATAEKEADDGSFDKGLWAKALVNAKGNKD